MGKQMVSYMQAKNLWAQKLFNAQLPSYEK